MTDMQVETGFAGAQMLTGFTEKRKMWGGVGTEGAVPIEEARKLIGWLPLESASNTATFITDDGVLEIDDPEQKKLLHPVTHQILGRHLQGYKVHGYEDTLLRDAARITDGELGIAKVTLLGGGRRAVVQYEFDENVTTREGVAYRPFLCAATSLDGSIATSFFKGSNIISCDNILHLSIRRAVKDRMIYKVRHTAYSEVNVTAAREALDIVFQTSEEFTAEIDRLTARVISEDQWKQVLDELVPLRDDASPRSKGMAERKRGELNRLWNYDEMVAPWKGSAYGVVAAVNTWANRIQTVRGRDREERNVANLIDGKFEELDHTVLRILERV